MIAPIASSAPAPAAASLDAGQPPSTEQFLQVLDMLLAGSPLTMPGISTSISDPLLDGITTGTSIEGSMGSSDDDSEVSPLEQNPKLCQDIASLLQSLGFQVRPEQLASLSKLDTEQLDTALEFTQRNLQRGADPGQVAESAALLLPRPWPLDDATGSPQPATAGPADPAAQGIRLPADFSEKLQSARDGLGKDGQGSNTDQSSQVAPAKASGSGRKSGFGNGTASGNDRDPQFFQPPPTSKSDAILVASEAVGRHLPPGGAASEMIGRQVLEKVHVQLSEGKREMSLRLWPEELGEVRLSLRMSDGDKVQAHMVVENDAVRQAMLDSMPQLREAMSRHGLDLEKMSVSVNQKEPDLAGSGSQGTREDAEGRGGNHGNNRGGRSFFDGDMDVKSSLVLGRDTGRRNGLNSFDLWS